MEVGKDRMDLARLVETLIPKKQVHLVADFYDTEMIKYSITQCKALLEI